MSEKIACGKDHERTKTERVYKPNEHVADKMCRIFSLLGDMTRLRIMFALLGGERCVCDLQEIVGATQAATSRHLRLLKDNDLVRSRREGKSVYYFFADGHINTILHTALEHVLENTGLLY